jgi:hypothetical protein
VGSASEPGFDRFRELGQGTLLTDNAPPVLSGSSFSFSAAVNGVPAVCVCECLCCVCGCVCLCDVLCLQATRLLVCLELRKLGWREHNLLMYVLFWFDHL